MTGVDTGRHPVGKPDHLYSRKERLKGYMGDAPTSIRQFPATVDFHKRASRSSSEMFLKRGYPLGI